MNVAEMTVLVTGANCGVGEAPVIEALNRGAKRVFAGTRSTLPNTDLRVTALTLDVTNALQIQRAVEEVADLDVLINNAAALSLTQSLRALSRLRRTEGVGTVRCGNAGPLKGRR